MWHHRDLIVAANDREDGLDISIGECGGNVASTISRRRPENPGGRILNRLQAELVAQPSQSKLVDGREDLG